MAPGGGGCRRGGGKLFNRKPRVNPQDFHKLLTRVEALEKEFDREKSANRRNLLEYADLGEKMRRVYLRIARLKKIESEESSTQNPPNGQEGQPQDARAVRTAIEKAFQ